jgi:hypothetical protein
LLETIGWSVLIHVQDIDISRSRDQLHQEASPRAIDYAAGRGPARGNLNFTADWRPPNSTTAGPCNEPSASKIHFSFKFAKDEFNLNIK